MEVARRYQAFYDCPRYPVCGAPICPLDVQMLERFGDPDENGGCAARRATRVAIAARYPDLPTGGLTHAEIARDRRRAAAKARWEALSPEEQARRVGRLKTVALCHE
jgi:hypothetical protein